MLDQHDWREQKTFLGLTRNDWSLIIITGLILLIVVFTNDWDRVFGLRLY